MPAKEIKGRIGIIACGGDVPWCVARACHDPFIIGLKSITDTDRIQKYDHAFHRIGAIGAIIKTLKSEAIQDICLIGSVQKPSIASLRPDLTGLKLLKTLNYNDLGDDGLLRGIRHFLESYGFTVHGAHALAPDLLTSDGVMTMSQPGHDSVKNIDIGIKAAQKLGANDKGQAVIVCDNQIIAEEGRGGTRAMIEAHGREHAILVKLCKPSQDRDLDLPTIGIETVQSCITKNMAGIAIHANESLFIDRDDAIDLANTHNFFIIGVTP